MIKVVAFIRRKPHLSRAEFLRFWQEEHPPLVLKLPGLLGYRQNPAIEHRKRWPWDGCAELWFDDVRAVAVAFDSPEAVPLRAHEEHFIEELDWFLASETLVLPPSKAS
ncbi:EthD family reductase [Nonomuraea sp. NPDC048916]|uniref:EthD family reductase n=1 Tax=Nonomuraea sp. NPDC048916 TaxID=3154232 RepID=UPI0033EB8857